MAETTDNFGLTKLEPGDDLSANGFAFIDSNISAIDRALNRAVNHDHTGASASLSDPTLAPSLVLDSNSGNLPAGTEVRYRYTYVDQYGAETAGSPEATVITPAAIQPPAGPSSTTADTGGTLLGGLYYYAFTAYTNTNTQETSLGGRVSTSVAFTTTTNVVTLTFPSLPSGADGFNIYRRAPGEARYAFLATVDMQVATPPTEYADDGTVATAAGRQPPSRNLTSSANNVTVTLPGATPTVPENATWKVYRTFVESNWTSSNLHHVTEETFVGSGVITPAFLDTGSGVGLETIPEVTQILDQPAKISTTQLEDNLKIYSPIVGSARDWDPGGGATGDIDLPATGTSWSDLLDAGGSGNDRPLDVLITNVTAGQVIEWEPYFVIQMSTDFDGPGVILNGQVVVDGVGGNLIDAGSVLGGNQWYYPRPGFYETAGSAGLRHTALGKMPYVVKAEDIEYGSIRIRPIYQSNHSTGTARVLSDYTTFPAGPPARCKGYGPYNRRSGVNIITTGQSLLVIPSDNYGGDPGYPPPIHWMEDLRALGQNVGVATLNWAGKSIEQRSGWAQMVQDVVVGYDYNIVVNTGSYTDIANGEAAEDIYHEQGTYLTGFKNVGVDKVVQITQPTNSSWGVTGFGAVRQAYNDFVRADASGYFDLVIDIEDDPLFAEPYVGTYFVPDGLHFNTAGADALAALVVPALTATPWWPL